MDYFIKQFDKFEDCTKFIESLENSKYKVAYYNNGDEFTVVYCCKKESKTENLTKEILELIRENEELIEDKNKAQYISTLGALLKATNKRLAAMLV